MLNDLADAVREEFDANIPSTAPNVAEGPQSSYSSSEQPPAAARKKNSVAGYVSCQAFHPHHLSPPSAPSSRCCWLHLTQEGNEA